MQPLGAALLLAVPLLVGLLLAATAAAAEQTQVLLDQGPLVGLKIFPDTSRTAVFAFLGVPYAQPPMRELRFAPPKPHGGWNWTLQATSLKPICPQPTNTIYDETADGTLPRSAPMDEDCLYLNIWVPESGLRFGNLPVLAVITGEEMAFDWPRIRATGLDFAAEGALVVTIQYRTNILGWISMDNRELAGNYGLLDQAMALRWIQHNIANFGGNPNQLTLLGHGTTGAPCALAHALHQADKDFGQRLIARLILMSGGDLLGALQASQATLEASKAMIGKLTCESESRGRVVGCLRTKSLNDLQKTFETLYDHGNWSLHLGPLLPAHLRPMLANASAMALALPPTMIGITSNEAAFLQDYWLELARQGLPALRNYINFTVLPSVLRALSIVEGTREVIDALNFRYFSGEAASNVPFLLAAMQRLQSEVFHETPFYRALELLGAHGNNTSETSPLFAYIFEHSNAMDMRGKVNLFGGAPHSADLPLLFGPTLFQQIARRRFTGEEEKLCQKLRTAALNFVRSGNPTPGRIYDAWLAYTTEHRFIYNLGKPVEREIAQASGFSAIFSRNLPQIEKVLDEERASSSNQIGLSRTNRNDYGSPNAAYPGGGVPAGGRSRANAYPPANSQDSGYAMHLKRVYGFWQVLLPNMAAFGGDGTYDGVNTALYNRVRLLEASVDAARYKQGFFAMLGLVAALLAILAVCVYLLRRDSMRLGGRNANWCL